MKIRDFFYKLTHWETWHYHVKYIPLLPVWIWYCIKARSLWFFTTSNPALTFGGMEGETKKEMYDQLPPGSYPKSIYVSPSISFDEVKDRVAEMDFRFPFAVKPNVGMMGYMFRIINNESDLQKYHSRMVAEYVIQDLVEYPVEVSVFYYRFPNQQKGTISGFLQKDSPWVLGDGRSTLWELIQAYPGVRFKLDEMKLKHEVRLNDVVAEGTKYYLSNASNRSQGGKLVGLEHEIDHNLVTLFDDISNYKGLLFYGRYDIKCASVQSLKEGKEFLILEYNGSGSGTQHIYGNGYTLFEAWKIILRHWKMLYRISKYNHKNGIPYWSFSQGLRFLRDAKRKLRILRQVDAEFPA